jgi:Mn-dependent DtxR family transcriptional regulator
MIDYSFAILRAIHDRSHAEHHNLASLDQVANDLGIHPSRFFRMCQKLRSAGLIDIFARYLNLTSAGRNIVENTW